jgi:uncharacterized repeat protein (TIGR04138 family)
MDKPDFFDVIEQIVADDPRFDRDAYTFVMEALDYTIKMLDKPKKGPQRHVTGRELLDGAREYALQEFGPLALTTLKTWGITSCEDIGAIVFTLVDRGLLKKSKHDDEMDFSDGYDFYEALRVPFLPAAAGGPAAPGSDTQAAGDGAS